MKIAHEAPLSIFDEVQKLTDYDYALVHLFEESHEYFAKFKQAVHQGRMVILDNSIFELGMAFDSEQFALWIMRLRPTYYIIPDVLEDAQGTIKNFEDWEDDCFDIPGKTIAVAQGKTYGDFIDCYQYLVDKVDKIAISFDYSFFEEWSNKSNLNHPTKYHKWVWGRQTLINEMLSTGLLRTDKPHHLLGCGLPQEFKAYKKYNWVDTIDTSNPVVHGILGIPYTESGLENKESVKLFTMIKEDVVSKWSSIEHNIKMFRSFCND